MRTKFTMEDAPTIEQTKAFASGMYQGAQLVADYMKDRWPTVNGVTVNSQTGHRDVSIKGLWGRAHAWMQTLTKLNDPLDFQATAVANRALLEITVDLILLHQDKTNASGWKMHWWGESHLHLSGARILGCSALRLFSRISVSLQLSTTCAINGNS